MIDIPIGETGMIAGKLYRAKEPENFGAKGCLCCDLHKKVDCAMIRCYDPQRTFEDVKKKDCSYEDYDDNPYNDMKWHEALVLLIILVPVGACIWAYDKTRILIDKIKKNATKKK